MTSTTERSFGARYKRGKDLYSYISTFTGYNPVRNEEKPAGFQALLDSIFAANTSEDTLQAQYRDVVFDRAASFKGKSNPTSVLRITTKVRAAVISQYGKNSNEFKIIHPIVNLIRNFKPVEPPADPNHPDAEKKMSHSQQSYGSIGANAYELIMALQTFSGYSPSNPQISIVGLKAGAAQIETYNTAVTNLYKQLRDARKNRLKLYADLKERADRIKAYAIEQYGTDSDEYTLIKGMQF